jgi:hypothetical protein
MPATNIKITAQDKTKRAFNSVKKSVSGLNSSVLSLKGALGGIGLAMGARAFVNFAKESLNTADALGKTADRLGLTTTALQTYRFAAEQSGMSTQTFEMAMQRFTRRASEAAVGTGEAKGALEQLGVALHDSSGKVRTSENMLNDVADALAKIPDQGERVRLAFKLFDSEGVKMVNMLQGGSAGLIDIRDQLEKTSGVLSEQFIRDSEEANDAMNKLSKTINVNMMQALSDLGPALTTASAGLQALLISNKGGGGSDWINKKVIRWSKALIGLRYGFEVVSVYQDAVFSHLASLFTTAVIQAERFGGIIITSISEAWVKVGNTATPTINTMIEGLNKLRSIVGAEPIQLIEVTKTKDISAEIDSILEKTGKRLKAEQATRQAITLETDRGLKAAKEMLNVRATAFLESQTQKAAEIKTTQALVTEQTNLNALTLDYVGYSEAQSAMFAVQAGEIAYKNDKLREQGMLYGEARLEMALNQEAFALAHQTSLEQDAEKTESVLQYKSVFSEAIISMIGGVRDLSKEEKLANEQKIDDATSTATSMVHSMKGFNKSWFQASQALSIAETIMNTYKGATAALAIPPPPVGMAFAATITALGMANVARIKSQKYQAREFGGPVSKGRSFMVGERGPELFTPNQSGNITANNKLSGPTNINFNIQANDAAGFDQLLHARRGMIVSMINRAMHEQGRRGLI